MIDWIFLGVYVAVWLLYGWRLTVQLLDRRVAQDVRLYPEEPATQVAREWLRIYLLGGFGLALCWPIVAPARGVFRIVVHRGLFTTPTERREAAKRELEQLRKLAKEHGLQLPEVSA